MQHKIKWIDVLKALTVIVMYIRCLGGGESITYNFVSTHYAALFFCVFGLLENYNTEENALNYVLEKVKTVLVPCFLLAYLVLIIVTIQYNLGLDFVMGMNGVIVNGLVRNTFAAESLWCLTCLFSIQLIFFFIKKLKYKWLIFISCFVLHCYNVIWMNSLDYPRWFFNIDSALYYVVFYAIGYLILPHVVDMFALDTKKKKMFFAITGGASMVYSVGLYFGIDVLSYLVPSFVWKFTPALRAVLIIWFYFVAARLLQEIKVLADIGKNMLYLCAGEYVLRLLIGTVMSILGLSFTTEYPVHILMYIGIVIFIGNKYLVPLEKYLVGKVVREV